MLNIASTDNKWNGNHSAMGDIIQPIRIVYPKNLLLGKTKSLHPTRLSKQTLPPVRTTP